MVARKFVVQHNDSLFDVDYDTEDGFEVLKFQLFSLTSIPPDEQKIFGGENLLVKDDSDLNSVTDKLRLVSTDEVDEGSSGTVAKDDNAFAQSDEELARMLQAEEEALFFQQFRASEDRGQFEQRIRPYVSQVLMYEDPVRQAAARKTVPVDELEEKAVVSLAKEGNFKPSKIEQDHVFLLQLLFWFKQTFRWVNAPSCDGCGSETINCGMGAPLPSEIQFGGSRVELYRCNNCLRITRFPRYNDPLKIVETRRGRCGEWANCFTLYCRAFGYESRLILDFTDHLWTECFSNLLGRWMHLDPCEGVYDKPLLYEKGWNKKLNYVVAIAKDGVHDVTKRYTRKWHEVLSRRNITTEPVVSAVLSDITKDCRKGFTPQLLAVLEDRDRSEVDELERGLPSQNDGSISLPGRQSGAKEWRIARSELGSNENNSLSCSECPIRICVDEHVTSILNAFCSLLSQFVENDIPKSKIVDILEMVKRGLLDLKKASFRSRSGSISLESITLKFVQQIIPPLDVLLAALSLKSEKLEKCERVNFCLAGDPVKTSIALPVALDALDIVIDNLRNSDNFGKGSLSLPLLKPNRISSGLVLASGEELPFGIVTSAFDGIHTSKWEEPNGAKGGWIIYKVKDNQMLDLEVYELMSANDAPERDPMNWVVEGSDDGGSSWYVLDKQTSQMFEKRFQRKTFKIHSVGRLSNAFRFRFLAVRDVQATSRLQIGSIDLFARIS
ncbi:peptide-N(4)-(N-acetyl-beta-glucosaminyl)asparagine amidase isoform X2 [Telopea speciosissima]|uniref:peptide-N(4)-(N-acetyl-beta- glucosaminyl)asparagine amidase isoform X2 n=1 Tax=Telopea speciosissima TaxID=54955 RepID=UPI001CC62E54|nr:peptide-N(4)-(N-acetyl-beta-glucosaminyl)asparagine amidase isoform X2 [Telopea speciosissima]